MSLVRPSESGEGTGSRWGPFSAAEKGTAVGSVPLMLALPVLTPLARLSAPGDSLTSHDSFHCTPS